MTNRRQDRVPDQTLSRGSAPGGSPSADGRAPASTHSIELAVRLWTQNSNGQTSAVSWQTPTPSVLMVLDLINASGGAPEPAQGPILRARFYNPQSALLMVRRLQWALQGFAEQTESGSIAVAILIHSAEDAPGEPIAAAIETATPGQVLLSNAIAESVNQLPNVTLRSAGESTGLVEVQWRSSETDSDSAADEQSVLRLIRERGREDPVAPQPQTAYPDAQTSRADTSQSAMPTGSFTPGRAHIENDSTQAAAKKKWLIIGGAAAAVALAVVLVIVGIGSRHHDKTPEPAAAQGAASPPAGAGTTTPTAATPSTPAAAPDGAKQDSGKNPPPKTGRTATRAGEAKVQTPPPGACDLTEGEIPRALDRAEGYLHAGRLSDASQVYQRLLGCPSARQRAAEGLQIVKQRIAAGSSQ